MLLFWRFPALKSGLSLASELTAAHLFVLFLVLVLAWTAGPLTAVLLTAFACLFSVYLALALREGAFWLQVGLNAALYLWALYYLLNLQRRSNDKDIAVEKLLEEIHLADEERKKNVHLQKVLDGKVERFFDLQRFSGELKGLPALEEASKKIVQEVHAVLDRAEHCALYLVDEGAQRLSLVSSSKREEEGPIKEKEGSLYDQWVMKRSQGLLIGDTRNDFRFAAETGESGWRLRSVCASPLVSESKVLGVMRVGSSRPRAFTTDDLRLLDIFSSLGAVTIRNILLYQKMAELAVRDSLTGLFLNRYFQNRLTETVRQADTRTRFALILLDIDWFKRYNDEYGHAPGDFVLKSIADTIRDCIGPGDLAARYGGEEFIVLLPGRTRQEAGLTAERMRSAVEASRFAVRRVEGRVTASFGVAAYPEGGRTAEQLLWKVDNNLYEAKRAGRNRICGSS